MCRIYVVHDEVKDKQFELELSWVGEGECLCHLAEFKTVCWEHSASFSHFMIVDDHFPSCFVF